MADKLPTPRKKLRRIQLASLNATRPVNAATVDLVRQFEGLYLKAYQDEVGVWTIGYGHTADEGDIVPAPGLVITEAKAIQLLAHDLNNHVARVQQLVTATVNDNMFGALVSFSFNLGDYNLQQSTLLSRVNTRRFSECINEFPKWNHAGGKVLPGLTRRRLSEANLFCSFPDPVVTQMQLKTHPRPRHTLEVIPRP